MEVFQDYALYYNAFYQDKDYIGEARQIDELLKKYGNCNIKKLMNFGCGTGKHDIELSKLGYQCTGIDVSPLMIDIAKSNIKNEQVKVEFYVADIRKYVTEKKYDAVISLFHVTSYQNGNDDIMAAFRSARKALDKGGLLLFGVWYGPGVLNNKPEVRVKEVEDGKYRLVRTACPVMHDTTNVVDVCYEVFVIDKETGKTRVINEIHKMRYFFRPEVEFYLKEADFELIDNLDCRTLEETDYDSWTSYFIAQAV